MGFIFGGNGEESKDDDTSKEIEKIFDDVLPDLPIDKTRKIEKDLDKIDEWGKESNKEPEKEPEEKSNETRDEVAARLLSMDENKDIIKNLLSLTESYETYIQNIAIKLTKNASTYLRYLEIGYELNDNKSILKSYREGDTTTVTSIKRKNDIAEKEDKKKKDFGERKEKERRDLEEKLKSIEEKAMKGKKYVRDYFSKKTINFFEKIADRSIEGLYSQESFEKFKKIMTYDPQLIDYFQIKSEKEEDIRSYRSIVKAFIKSLGKHIDDLKYKSIDDIKNELDARKEADRLSDLLCDTEISEKYKNFYLNEQNKIKDLNLSKDNLVKAINHCGKTSLKLTYQYMKKQGYIREISNGDSEWEFDWGLNGDSKNE